MKNRFIPTRNAKEFLVKLKALEERGAAEACLMVVDGVPGLGKSRTLQWWATKTGSTLLRAKQEWTPNWMMRDLLSELGVTPEHWFERMFEQALQAIFQRKINAQREGQEYGVVIDEADHISRRPRLLETLRDLSDMLECPFILVGMGRIRHNLTRFEQVAGRVAQYVEFKPCPLDDTKALVEGLCEVPVGADLTVFLHEATGGRSREIKEAIAAIERFGRRNAGKTIGLSEMAGEFLVNDRRSGRPVKVRA